MVGDPLGDKTETHHETLKHRVKSHKWISRVFGIVRPPDFKLDLVGSGKRKRFSEIIEEFRINGFVLNVGSGPKNDGNLSGLSNRILDRTIGFDFIHQPGIDFRADVARIPLKNNSVAGVLFQGVLEHIYDPAAALQEIERVLVPGGVVYVEAPFLQHFHSDPIDLRRYTTDGLDHEMRAFEKVESGVLYGPSAVVADVLSEYVAVLSRSALWYWMAKVVMGWLMFAFKFIDVFLIKKPQSKFLCFGVYYLGRKRI
ncbi:class I SAM-dependent methyltransferase [bacterium]|nr:MAG: class I SAM-dependent methyltransferase [bacterium]